MLKIKLQALRVAGAFIRVVGEMRRLPAYFDNPVNPRVKTSASFVRKRSGSLFSFSPSCSHNLLLSIENKQFRVLYPVFVFFFT